MQRKDVIYKGKTLIFILQYHTDIYIKTDNLICHMCRQRLLLNESFWFTRDGALDKTLREIQGNAFYLRAHDSCLTEFEANPNKIMFQLKLGLL